MPTFTSRVRARARRFGKRHPGARVAAKRAIRVGALAALTGVAGFIAGRRSRTLYRQLRVLRGGGAAARWRADRLKGVSDGLSRMAADKMAFRARRARRWGNRLFTGAAVIGGVGTPYVLRPAFEAHADALERGYWQRKANRGETKPVEVWLRKKGKLTKRAKQGRRFR